MRTCFRKTLSALALAATAALTSTSASAVTLQFDTFVTGQNLGSITVATLDAVQNGANVDFTLTATYVAEPSSYIDYLRLNYTGTAPTTATHTGGVAYDSFSTGNATDASYTFNIKFDWPNSNAGGGALRLNPGEFSSFSISNVSLGLFDFDPYKSLLHINALAGAIGSAKYTATPVPVPASLPLLLVGLGGFAAMRWRRRKS